MAVADTLESFLSEHHARYTLEHHPPSYTSAGTARTAHVSGILLAKSVLLEDESGPVLVVLPASHRLKLGRIRSLLGRPLDFAKEGELKQSFPDCSLGALPPVGDAYGLPTVLDTNLACQDEIFFEAGDHETLVHMSGQQFRALLDGASMAEVAYESEVLDAAAVSRERLYDSLLEVSEAIGAPIGSGSGWRIRLSRGLSALRRALADHIEQTESADGLLMEIEMEAPRLAREVAELRDEHCELVDECERVALAVQAGAPSADLRGSVLGVLGRLAQHRHRGADLVYEAFGVDIGGG